MYVCVYAVVCMSLMDWLLAQLCVVDMAANEGMKLRPNRFEVFNTLNADKLIIIGKKDTLINREQLLSKIENTDINVAEFSEGHMSYIENLSELTYFLLQFIEK